MDGVQLMSTVVTFVSSLHLLPQQDDDRLCIVVGDTSTHHLLMSLFYVTVLSASWSHLRNLLTSQARRKLPVTISISISNTRSFQAQVVPPHERSAHSVSRAQLARPLTTPGLPNSLPNAVGPRPQNLPHQRVKAYSV
jgi:hypothetical protein